MLTPWVTLKLILDQTMLEGEAIAAFRASPLHRGTTKIIVNTLFRYWLVWQSGLVWIMLTLWVKLKLILDQTMLDGEAIAAFRTSPFHGGTT